MPFRDPLTTVRALVAPFADEAGERAELKKAASREYVLSRARKLASSGRHLNYITIGTELWNEGHFQACIWLD
jgi:hypothetical protein